jgi:hypothetical protein
MPAAAPAARMARHGRSSPETDVDNDRWLREVKASAAVVASRHGESLLESWHVPGQGPWRERLATARLASSFETKSSEMPPAAQAAGGQGARADETPGRVGGIRRRGPQAGSQAKRPSRACKISGQAPPVTASDRRRRLAGWCDQEHLVFEIERRRAPP